MGEYESLKQALEQEYGKKIEVTGKIYPLPCWKRLLSMYLTFFLIMFALVMIFEPFDLLDNLPTIVTFKLPIVVIVSLVVMMVRFNLSNSYAFEVSFDD